MDSGRGEEREAERGKLFGARRRTEETPFVFYDLRDFKHFSLGNTG